MSLADLRRLSRFLRRLLVGIEMAVGKTKERRIIHLVFLLEELENVSTLYYPRNNDRRTRIVLSLHGRTPRGRISGHGGAVGPFEQSLGKRYYK
jgi:hypothetical protein